MSRNDEIHQFDWYLVKETDAARLFSESADGADAFWVPKSVLHRFSKYPATSPMHLPLCLVEVEEWFCLKEKLI